MNELFQNFQIHTWIDDLRLYKKGILKINSPAYFYEIGGKTSNSTLE